MTVTQLESTARALVSSGKGILAAEDRDVLPGLSRGPQGYEQR